MSVSFEIEKSGRMGTMGIMEDALLEALESSQSCNQCGKKRVSGE
jgi:hypothetical protein